MPNTARNDLTIYDKVADYWWSDDIRWVRTLKNLVPGRLKWFDRHVEWAGKTALDLGCAGGFMAEALAKKGAVVTGIDPASQAIEAAQAHAEQNDLKIKYDVGVGEQLPYANSVFDVVVCVDVLEHVDDLGQVISEIERVLKPGGTFVYDTINRNVLSRFATIAIVEDILRLLPKGTHDPALYVRPSELSEVLEMSGLNAGPTTGLGPRGINRRGDFVFGPFPSRAIIYMGIATKPRAV